MDLLHFVLRNKEEEKRKKNEKKKIRIERGGIRNEE
jgi:hypothetical protein